MLVFRRYSRYSQASGWQRGGVSYALLFFLVIGVGVVLASVATSARSDTPCQTNITPTAQGLAQNGECTGSYTVNAVVPGPRPSKPAVITSPTSGQTFDNNPVTVAGTCPDKALIKIFTNGVLVGSILCGVSGHFTLPVDLVIGKNDLTALPYNAADLQGPTSPTVSVTLNQPAGGVGFSTELLIQSENYFRGTQPGQEVVWPIELVGGTAPYAVSVDWGDGTQDLVTRLAPGPFTVKHTYSKTGGYLGEFPLIIRATDAAGHNAYLQLTTIVNSPKGGVSAPTNIVTSSKWWFIWPLWIVLLLMVLSFWLGERREKHILRKQMAAVA